MSGCIGAAAAGARTATATSSQGLALMVETLYQASGMRMPIVLCLINRALAAPLNVNGDSTVNYRNLRKHLPGPYTFILPGTREVPKTLLSKQKTVGVRIPDHPLTLAIVEALGNPIISTSVNISAKSFASDPQEFSEYYEGQVDLILDSGPTWAELSSVIDMTDDDQPIVIREGQGDVSWCLI
jgi:tRNA threonylcarbamoyl adenosine modification protein (Sua5/YciO/YrdC/YwlC family)